MSKTEANSKRHSYFLKQCIIRDMKSFPIQTIVSSGFNTYVDETILADTKVTRLTHICKVVENDLMTKKIL